MPSLYRPTVLVAAALLFLAEPLAAKQLLPLYGGSAAVWITCLVFFQGALLAGYTCAHLLARMPGRSARWPHLLLLAGALLSAILWARAPTVVAAGGPVAGIFLRLAGWLGLPFVALGATSPLLQVWLKRASGGAIPYSLYAWSNAASLLALLAYPALIEPALPLRTQRICWACGLAVFAALSGIIAWQVPATVPEPPSLAPVPTQRRRLLWFGLAMVGSMQLSAVTAHLTGNVAAIPLLWVLPLALYLATFILAFQDRIRIPVTALAGFTAVLLIAVGDFVAKSQYALPIGLAIGLFLAELTVACLFCHSALYRLRPETDATAFYLILAAGGAAGAMLIGVWAPLVFHANYDLSITLAATAAAALAVAWPAGARQRLLWVGCTLVLLALCVQLRRANGRQSLASERNFYGSLRVSQQKLPSGAFERRLFHGTIIHGTELIPPTGTVSAEPAQRLIANTYFAPGSGAGLALANCCGTRGRSIGVVGLGVGTLAAYTRPGDTLRFYEINPAVEPLARTFFDYLQQSPVGATIVPGDGRAALARESAERFDVLVLDAFSGDAIPLHLLTVEAVEDYKRHLRPGGMLAFHISNRYVDLEPELQQLAAATGLKATGVHHQSVDLAGLFDSDWVLLTAPGNAWPAAIASQGHGLRQRPGVKPWTDDYSSLLSLVRW